MHYGTDTVDQEIEIIETTKVWVCLNEKKDKCTGRMRTKSLEIINFSDNLCKPDVAASEVKKQFDNARKRVREESSYTSSQIFRQEMSTLFQKGYDHVTNIPTYASAKTTLNRIKKRTLERIIAFSSSAQREAASTYRNFFFDGTFKSRSKQFLQIYTIHVDIGSTSKHIQNFNPNIITIDFEAATIQVIKDVFPNTQISGFQNVKLVDEYRYNEEIRLNIRMCSALALIPFQDIDEGWLIIMESSPNNEKLKLFYDYFVEQWLENEIMSKTIWNCHQKRHRTNNVVEEQCILNV
ncbi:hypothetical protein QTP88_015417 [Uroleucon formosanum]